LQGRSRLCGVHTEDTPDFGKRPRLIDFYLEEPTASLARFSCVKTKRAAILPRRPLSSPLCADQ
jgi:hypothetical protein